MRAVTAVALLMAACSCSEPPDNSEPGDAGGVVADAGGEPDSGVAGPTILRIDTGSSTVPARTTRVDCYFATMDVDIASGVRRWSSTMSPAVYELIVYLANTAEQPDGTRVEACAPIFGTSGAQWAHFAQTPTAQNVMPSGVGIPIEAQQHIVVEMRLYNPSDAPIEVNAAVEAELLPPQEAFESAAAFVALATSFAIPANSTNYSVEKACSAPTGSFFTLTTFTHRQSVHTEVRDGTEVIFNSNDWESPGEADWRVPPHHPFAADLVFQCVYVNPTVRTITMGDSPDGDEMCMVVGWRFPATETSLCIR